MMKLNTESKKRPLLPDDTLMHLNYEHNMIDMLNCMKEEGLPSGEMRWQPKSQITHVTPLTVGRG